MPNESEIENLLESASEIEVLLIKKSFEVGMSIGQNITNRIKEGTLDIPIDGKFSVKLLGSDYQIQNQLGILDNFIPYTSKIIALGNAGLVYISAKKR